jgi:flavin-dependent dehydrogenase
MVDAISSLRFPRSAMSEVADAVIVGGGLAGGALAVSLAEAGRRVVLLERETGPHDKVCGEFLSHEAALYLASLGLDLPGLGAERIKTLRLAVGRRVVAAALPFPAFSLSRRVLDEALLQRAAAAGADIRRGAGVRELARRDGRWEARVQDGGTVLGAAAFLATGKHDVRGWARPPGLQPDLLGFKMHWRLSPTQAMALSGHVELTLFAGGYAGLEPIEGGLANLCLLIRRSRFAALGQRWEALLEALRAECPLLAGRLEGAEPCWPRPLAIAAIPYGHIAGTEDGVWRLGDQAAVIPSFAGDGMSIALHSARLAAHCFLSGGGATGYQRRIARDVGGAVRMATLLSRMAVHPLGRYAIGPAALLAPGGLSRIASLTRIPLAALRRAGLSVA